MNRILLAADQRVSSLPLINWTRLKTIGWFQNSALALLLPGILLAQILPQYQFAGFRPPGETHLLSRPLVAPVVATIPIGNSDVYVYEGESRKLSRLNFASDRRTDLPLSLTLSDACRRLLPCRPDAIGVDKNGVLYLSDTNGDRVLRVMPNGAATVFAGTGAPNICDTPIGAVACDTPFGVGDGGPATKARFLAPFATAVDSAGNVYISDVQSVRKVDAQGKISTFVGCLSPCKAGPLGINRSLKGGALAVDRRDNLYLTQGKQVYVLNPSGEIVEIRQRQDPAKPGVPVDIAQLSGSKEFGHLRGIAIAPDNSIWLSDDIRNVIWKIGTNGYSSIAVGRQSIVTNGRGDRVIGPADYQGNGPLHGDERLSGPGSIALDSNGRLLIADVGNSAIRAFIPAESLVTLAGQRLCCYGEEGIAAAEATLEFPRALAADGEGNIYVADAKAGRVRKIDRFGRIATVLGNGSSQARVGVAATETGAQPYGLAVDSKGYVYVAEPALGMIRRVTPGGFVESIAGPPSGAFPRSFPEQYAGQAVAVGPDDALYYLNGCNVMRWAAGRATPLLSGACKQSADGPALSASVNDATALAVGADGAVYIGAIGSRIRVIRNGRLETLAGSFPGDSTPSFYSLHYGKDNALYATDYWSTLFAGSYTRAYALSSRGAQIPIATTSFLPTVVVRVGDFVSYSGFVKTIDPFPLSDLWAIATDPAGRVFVTFEDQVLVFPKVQGGN